MEPPAIISDGPFPSRAIFWPSGHTLPIRGTFQCRGCLSFSIGSQWVRYLPDQGNRSRWSRRRLFRRSPFPSRAIFLPSGVPRGLSNAGAAYLFQLEANGSATYLTKVTAPDGATAINFGYSVSQSGNILAAGAQCRSIPMPELLIFINWNPMDPPPYLTKVTAPDGANGDNFGHLRFQSGNILAVGASEPIRFPLPGLLIFINWKPMDPLPT